MNTLIIQSKDEEIIKQRSVNQPQTVVFKYRQNKYNMISQILIIKTMGNSNLLMMKSKSEKSSKKTASKHNQSKPVGVNSGIKIKFNKKTGLLEGFPKEWSQYDLNLPIDKSKMIESSHYDIHIKPTILPQKIIDMVVSSKIGLVVN